MTIDPDDFRPLPITDPKASADRAEAEALLAQANKMHNDAKGKAQATLDAANTDAQHMRDEARSLRVRTLADATSEANTIRATAKAEAEQRQRRDDNLDTWAARAVIAGAVGLTASGEYSLARMAGFDPEVAWLLPFVIDVYVIQAFRRHRDIVQAIALTIGANVTYHLAEAGLFGVTARREPTWWLIALVASVASLILWRMHLMVRPPRPAKEPRQKGRQEDRQEGPAAATVPAPAAPPTQAPSAANNDRQEAPTGGANKRQNEPAKKAPTGDKKPTPPRRQNAAKKRRSMDDWVADAGPVFHAEFARLRRNPTATEFATAIQKAGLGKVSDSTAKNIRAEILDRTPLPELDGTE